MTTLDLFEAEKPTMTNGFVAGIGHLARDSSLPRRDLSSMRRGNLYPIMAPEVRPADPELRHTMLGMTEAGSVITISADESDQPEHRRGSFGKPAPGFETKVDDNGELCIRGPFVMQRYYKRSREECFDADGWFRTGDLVRVDQDGFVYFVGRLGAMIKTAGANVAPAEVEHAIAKATGADRVRDRHRRPGARTTGSGRHRHRWSHRRVVAAQRAQGGTVGVQDPQAHRRRSPGTRSRCSPAARSTCIGSRRCSMPESPRPSMHWFGSGPPFTPTSRWSSTRWSASRFAELDASTHAMAASFLAAGVTKGSRVGLIMPNGVRWVQTALALTRIGAVLVPLSTLLAPRELVAQLRVASVQYLVAVDEFRGHRYHDDIATERANLPALREVWTPDELTEATRRCRRASPRRSPPPTPLSSCSPREAAGRRRASSTHTATRCGAVQSGLAARCIDADTRLYLPMPFFWVGGFGSGILSALLAGATLVTEQIPQPETTLRLLEREQVTLFRGWPDQAQALAQPVERRSAPTCPHCDRAASRRCCPPISGRQPGARAKLFGMTEAFGPYCGYPADTDMPESAWGSPAASRSTAPRSASSTPTPAHPCPPGTIGMIQIRGPNTLRGICRRSREDVFTADGYYPTGDLGHLDDDGFMFYHGRSDDMFKVSGATVYPSEVEQALRGIDGVENAFVTDVAGQVGAVVIADGGVDHLRAAARKLLSSFKVPTVWLLVDSDDAIPRGGDRQGRRRGAEEDAGHSTGGSTMKTKGALIWDFHQPWSVEEIEIGDPRKGEVKVALEVAGMCHSDHHVVTGDIPVLGISRARRSRRRGCRRRGRRGRRRSAAR